MEETNIEQESTPPTLRTPIPPTKPNYVPVIGILLVLLIAIGAGGYFYVSKLQSEIQMQNNTLMETNAKVNDLTTQLSDANKKVEELTCKGVWDPALGCQASKLTLVSPNGGEIFCMDQKNLIQWNGPSDMESVQIWIKKQTLSRNIGEFKAVNEVNENVGLGKLEWFGKDVIGGTIEPADFYKIEVRTLYKGEQITDESDAIFTLKNCS